MIIEGITQSKDVVMTIGCPVVVDFVGFFSQSMTLFFIKTASFCKNIIKTFKLVFRKM